MHPKFEPTGVLTRDLQIMNTTFYMALRCPCLSVLATWPSSQLSKNHTASTFQPHFHFAVDCNDLLLFFETFIAIHFACNYRRTACTGALRCTGSFWDEQNTSY